MTLTGEVPKVGGVPKVDCVPVDLVSQAVGASTQVSINSRASYRVPSVIRGCTVTTTGNYFDNANRHSRQDITGRKVVCPKGKHGPQGLCDYNRHHSAATAAIPELYGAAKHFRTKNSDGELSYKYKDIQSKYVGNLDMLKLFRKRMEAFDMFGPFIFPPWIDPDAISVLDCWGDRKTNRIDITKHWSQVLLKHMCAWQRDTFDWCTDDNDLTSMEYVNSLTPKSVSAETKNPRSESFWLAKHKDTNIHTMMEPFSSPAAWF